MNRPITIEGALSRMSLTKRTTDGEPVVAAIFGQVGAGQDADRRADQRPPATVMIRLPTMALSRPPAAPGGGVISVNTASDSPPTPFAEQHAQDRAPASRGRTAVAAQRQADGDRVAAAAAGDRARCRWPCHPPACARCAQQHVARDRQHDEGDDEQDQAERDQRGGVEVADRLGEFVGDGGRDRGAGREERGRDAVRVADHEGDRHGLAERAAERQHDAADHADAGVGQHDIAHTLPRWCSRGRRPLPSAPAAPRRTRRARSTVMKGSTMIARISPAVSMPMP